MNSIIWMNMSQRNHFNFNKKNCGETCILVTGPDFDLMKHKTAHIQR